MIAVVWEAISGGLFVIAGVYLAFALWNWPPLFPWRQRRLTERLVGVVVILFGTYLLALAAQGYVTEKGRVVRYR